VFDAIQKRLSGALAKVRGRSTISEDDISEVLKEIRTGLLEGDVHFKVVKDFLARIKERCLREEVIKSLSPEEQILKVLNDELTTILGGQSRELNFEEKTPNVILMCGLQGSGKTTTTVKLANLIKNDLKKRVAVVSVDVYRPAAMEQLKQLSGNIEVDFLPCDHNDKPVAIAKNALEIAKKENFDVLIVDTAGRLQIDDQLMDELADVAKVVNPSETLLVIDTMMGQQAVDVADGFDRKIGITGSVLSKLDGDSRGGAALSLVSVTGKPIKFIGTGERPDDFEVFHPDRMASRILDMGDVLSLIEKAEKAFTEEEAQEALEKIQNDSFSLVDFQKQMKMVNKMGSLSSLFKMLPGMASFKDQLNSVDTDSELTRINSMINSMTLEERSNPDVLNGSRRSRIALGCGRSVTELNQFLKRFFDTRKMMKKMGKMGGMMKGMMGDGSSAGGANAAPFGKKRRGKGFGRKF